MGTSDATTTTTVDELVRAHGAGLLRYATGLMNGDRAAAEDVVQETWLRAWRHLDRLTEQQGSVRGWLTRVTHNIAMDQLRARRCRPAEVAWSELDTERVAAPHDPAHEVEDRIVVAELLGHVSELHRRTIHEVYFSDLTAAGAAATLGVPVGTVKSRVFHALRSMRTQSAAFAA
ncbi:sigma-70 family RNA polymerase sigma factor [Mycetocola reblochoni]|uniref:RNA polymerase sigma-70 factor, ECF subfamily n=2 Tax=Mycetocola reblochoni TaxID=331618 RepID=A0A1R4I7W4_9MICO|nr:sigma-70 family RNA polymerase sigma factor [Mycetocola reblochoni]RLP68930.1 sigma-70 family RNA polymerase sigma factor [Mycetocola reblochoni]SJN15878.1 RNA polymerase sigma-70 factor, ECF subfamily [Mycetocola reblochoni REB411]